MVTEAHWQELVERLDHLEVLVKRNAGHAKKAAQDAAQNAAVRVTAENTRAQERIRQELLEAQKLDREVQLALSKKVDKLADQMGEVLTTMNKVMSQRLISTGITALVLAALVIIGIKVMGG